MRIKKYRGFQNLWEDIESWVEFNKPIDLDYFNSQQRDWVKIWISPFSDLSLTDSDIPQPKGKARKLITQGLIDIYKARKKQLDTLAKPYYLKIWLYDQRFSRSQVVCAVDDCIDFYDITHSKPEQPIKIENSGIKDIAQKYPEFTWEHRLDEELYNFNELGTPDDYCSLEDYEERKRWYTKMGEKKHRKASSPNFPDIDYRAFPKGNVWIGEIKN